MKTRPFEAILSALALAAAPLSAGVLFEEAFESPDISGYQQGVTPPDTWIRAQAGFGSGDHGMTDKDSGDFTASSGNDQAYAFRYTNSGLTTAEGVLGPPLAIGGAYQVTFDVVKDNTTGGKAYNVRLVAFAAGAPRNDCRSIPSGSVSLATASGNALDNGTITTATLNFTPTAGSHGSHVGKDLGIRAIGTSGSAIIDNVRFRTVAGANAGVNRVTTTPLDNETKALTYDPLLVVFDKNIAKGSGNITLRNLTNPGDTVIPVSDPRVTVSGTLLQIEDDSLLQWNKNYAVLIDAGTVVQTPGGTPFAGIADETTWNFSTAVGDPLLYSVARLKDHILGNITLGAAEIDAIKIALDGVIPRYPESAETITALLDLVETYDAELGPLWVARGFPQRDNVTNDLHWTMFNVMQNIMDRIYTKSTLAAHEALLDGFKFGSSSNFPGACAPPANPANVHTATISASYLDSFGKATIGDGPFTFARKPTGTYLAPGTIATVTVPPSMVNTGCRIRVGANSWNYSEKPDIKRLDRVTRSYVITSTETKVANPLGGGIYIEVPWLANAGVVNVDITGAVRSPYFSAKTFQTTTQADWENIERNHPGPWADFQTDKFMMQVPKSWIFNMSGAQAAQLMADWDASVDAVNDLLGYPRIRGKESIYPQVDLLLKNSVYAPGYPSVNTTYSPTGNYGGYAGSHLVRGPQNAPYYEFHELGHGYFFPKFPGENESNVNLLHVAVMNRAFGKSMDESHSSSMGGSSFQTLDATAIAWMCCFSFSPREQPMNSLEKQYQLKGHAKFVDIALLYGWDALDDYWRGMMEAEVAGTPYSTTIDGLLLRLCQATGRDIRPLFHFWGIHPQNPATLAANIAAANIPPDEAIKNRLLHYKSLVPANNSAFRSFTTGWWGGKPRIEGNWEETDHAMQWDETEDADGGAVNANVRPNGDIYVEASAAEIRARVDELVELYFPSVLGPDPMVFAIAPTAMDATTVTMTSVTATAPDEPVQYYFENFTNGNNSGWITEKSWTNTGLTTGQSYQFRVKARDGLLVETGWSALAGATPVADSTPPAPNPMAFATPPAAVDLSSIIMTAALAGDVNGVEYYFQCTAGGGPDSGWQSGREYTASGLEPGTEYSYVVRARDAYGNTTTNSAGASATTLTPDTTAPAIVSLNPAHQSDSVAVAANLVATFDENIAIGSGNITIRNLTDGPSGDIVIAVTDASQVSVSGAVLTINPNVNFLSGKAYAIRIDATAIDDLSGNGFTGIANDTTWAFASAVVPYVWAQTAGGAQPWSTDANWQGGIAPSPIAGDTVDFSTVNIAADTSLTLGADRTANVWRFGDTSGAQNWTVIAGNQINLAGATPTIQVNQNTTTLNSVVAGTSGLRKTGAGTLALNADNSFSGGINLSAGRIQVSSSSNANALGASSNVVTFTGDATLYNSNNTFTMAQGMQVNSGVTASLLGAFQEVLTVNGPVTGSGTLRVDGASTGWLVNLQSTSNSFTGPIEVFGGSGSATLRMRSLADSANPIRLGRPANTNGAGIFEYQSGATTPLLLNSRQFELSSTTSAASIVNNAATANTITVNTDIAVTGTGNKTLTLGGSNTGANVIAGNIPKGPGSTVISLTKADAGTWAINGPNNAFTGAVTVSGGKLSFASLAGTNPIAFTNTTGTVTLAYTGASPLVMSGLITASAMTSGTVTLDASGTSPSAAVGFSNANSFTGVATSNTVRKLVLTGNNTGNNTFAGALTNNTGTSNAATLTKNGTGTWILTGANAHTGTTSISDGKLFINGDQSSASGAVSVSANATLGGKGIIGGNTAIATNGKLEFNVGPNAPDHDKLELAAGKTLSFGTGCTLTITSGGGALTGLYTLVTAPGGIGTLPTFTVNLPAGWTADPPAKSGNDLVINITSTGVTQTPYEQWSGGAAFEADSNNDGIDNGLAWVLGAANPNANAIGLLPTIDNSDATWLVFNYRRSDAAFAAGTTIATQFGTDLNGWTTAVAGPDVIITPTDNAHGTNPGIDNVEVKIRRTLAPGGKLFVRLVATP